MIDFVTPVYVNNRTGAANIFGPTLRLRGKLRPSSLQRQRLPRRPARRTTTALHCIEACIRPVHRVLSAPSFRP